MKTKPTIEPQTVPFVLTVETIENLLCSAFEGGSNYWARFVGAVQPEGAEHPHEAPLLGGNVTLRTIDDDDPDDVLTLDATAIARGAECFARVAPITFADVLTDSIDAGTGDVFLQCCLFGKLVYA